VTPSHRRVQTDAKSAAARADTKSALVRSSARSFVVRPCMRGGGVDVIAVVCNGRGGGRRGGGSEREEEREREEVSCRVMVSVTVWLVCDVCHGASRSVTRETTSRLHSCWVTKQGGIGVGIEWDTRLYGS
jgi:hypothetical protein